MVSNPHYAVDSAKLPLPIEMNIYMIFFIKIVNKLMVFLINKESNDPYIRSDSIAVVTHRYHNTPISGVS